LHLLSALTEKLLEELNVWNGIYTMQQEQQAQGEQGENKLPFL